MINRDCRCPGCGVCDAAEAIDPLKKERTVLRKSVKEEKQRYDELFRMTESYIKRLHTAEEENKRLREVTASYISDVSEYGESFCNAAGHNPETCNECRLKELIK
jgi:hypothetical protein